MRKIVFVFSDIGKGGAEKFVFLLAGFLKKNGYIVTIISLGKQKDYSFLEIAEGITVLHCTRKSKFDMRPLGLIREYVVSNRISLFFCIDFFAFLYIGLLRKMHNLPLRLILSPHSTIPIKKSDWMTNNLGSLFLRKTDLVIFISGNQKKYIDKFFILVKKAKNIIVHNGVDFSKYKVISEVNKRRFKNELLNISPELKVIVLVAGFRPEKDHVVAIKALEILIKKYQKKVCLLLIGDGNISYIESLKELCCSLDIENSVIFLGFKRNVAEYLSTSDLFTLTSHSVETFSLAALEALASGLPIVLTNIGGASEMVNEENGRLTIPSNTNSIAEGWLNCLNNKYDSSVIRENALLKYDIKIMNNLYLNAIESLLSNKVL